jgi:hypothetical protein
MTWTRLSLCYLCGYLLAGGLTLLVFPLEGLRLLLSNGDYGEVLPRVVGMLMTGLGVVVVSIIATRTEALYPVTLGVRNFFLICIGVFFATTRDPLFLTVGGIVGLGVVLTGLGYLADRRSRS